METSKRVGAAIQDTARFIQNWFVYTLMVIFIIAISGYVASITFRAWQSDWKSWEFNIVDNAKYYGDSWIAVFNDHQYQGVYEEQLREYYNNFYKDYRFQLEGLKEPDRTILVDQLDELINTEVDKLLEENLQPLSDGYLSRLLIVTLAPLSIFGLLVFLLRAPLADFKPFEKDETLHGDAKWATEKHIKEAGLRAKQGLMLGQDNRGYLVAPGFQHALLFAPTGSGKGVGFVIPNLLFWEDSCFIHDIKLENFELTSGFRRDVLKQDVFLWAPADPDGVTHCYNPIDWVSKKPGQMVDDVQKIANLILPEQEFWNNEARSLFVGVTLYLLAVPDKIKSFGEVVRTLRSDDVVYNLAVVLDTIGKKIHPVSYMNIAAFLQKADKERSGVISTLNSGLELWANPIIDTATSRSDFNIQDMKRRKTTVYVGLTPDNIQRLQPLLQVFYQQATEFLARKIPDEKDEPHGVMFMMDEFPTLGEMKQFHSGIAYFRGYNVRLFLIVQDTQQLKGIYEEHGMNTFLSNSTYRVTFAANNVETANLISQLIGNKTVKQQSLNKPKYLDLNPATRTIHESEIQRALLLPQEVIGLPRDEQIILIESTPPIKTKKVFYYKDAFFKRRLLDPIEIPIQEPFDARKIEEEKKKKEKEEKKKKEEEKKKATPPPAAAPLPDMPEMESEDKKDESSSDGNAELPPPPSPPAPPAAPEAPENASEDNPYTVTTDNAEYKPNNSAEPATNNDAQADQQPSQENENKSAPAQQAGNNFEDDLSNIFGDDVAKTDTSKPSEDVSKKPKEEKPEDPTATNNDEASSNAVPKLDDLPDFPELPDIPSKIDNKPEDEEDKT